MKTAFHDILNDFAVAMGLAQAFLDEKLEPTPERFQEIVRALERASTLISELRHDDRGDGIPRTESVLNAIVEGSPYAKVLVDGGGRITLVNAEAEKLFGFPRAEMVGRSVEMLVPARFKVQHPDLRHSFNQQPEARAMGAGRDLFGRRKDGSEFPIEIGLNPIVTDKGAFTLAAISDITERKRAEELRLLHAGIQQHAADLEQLNRELANASRFKTQFISTMSHELRTPLTAIIGSAELLARSQLSEREASLVAAIHEASEALLALIGSILDFSKIEAGKMDLQSEPFLVASVVASAVDVIAALLRNKHVSLGVSVEPSIPPLCGDAARLRQILLNLLGNSAKFTETGHIIVRVSASEPGEGKVRLRFEIEDTGIGIEPEFIQNLFEPFTQAVPARAKKFGGSGLGLSITKRLVELMDGEMGVASDPGSGTLMWFTACFDVAAHIAPPPTLTGLACLVLSADDAFVHTVRTYLAARSVETVRGRSGAEVLKALQSSESSRWVAIVDRSGLGVGDVEVTMAVVRTILPDRIVLVGGDGPLTKPLDANSLYEAIETVLGGRHSLDCDDPETGPVAGAKSTFPVLVAEDDIRLQRLLQVQFDDLGIAVEFVSDGLAAVKATQERTFAMVMMDCQMPELDGLSATKAIRDAERRTGAHVAVVAMTANAFAEDRDACLAAGMDDYLAKPVRLEQLRAVVRRWSASPAGPRGEQSFT